LAALKLFLTISSELLSSPDFTLNTLLLSLLGLKRGEEGEKAVGVEPEDCRLSLDGENGMRIDVGREEVDNPLPARVGEEVVLLLTLNRGYAL
jgi:hypothetical protein